MEKCAIANDGRLLKKGKKFTAADITYLEAVIWSNRFCLTEGPFRKHVTFEGRSGMCDKLPTMLLYIAAPLVNVTTDRWESKNGHKCVTYIMHIYYSIIVR